MSDDTPGTLGNVSLAKAVVGHVLTLVVMVVSVASWGATVSARVTALEERVLSLENDLMPLMRDLRDDVNDVKVQLATVSTDVQWLKTSSLEEKD